MSSENQSSSIQKKKVVMCIIMIVVIAVIAVCAVFAVRAVAKSRFIGETKAEQIALKDAGVDASEANMKRTEFAFDDWQFEYEVEFYTNNGEYEYTIAASDGRILDRDIDMYSAPLDQKNGTDGNVQDIDSDAKVVSGNSSEAAGTDEQGYIGVDRAKEIALAHAGLNEQDVTFTKAKLDRDDRMDVYEIEFINGSMEHEYKIQAADGKILEYDLDHEHD